MFVQLSHCTVCTVVPVRTCGASCVGVWFVGSFVSQTMMSIVLFVILLHLLVARAIHTRDRARVRIAAGAAAWRPRPADRPARYDVKRSCQGLKSLFCPLLQHDVLEERI